MTSPMRLLGCRKILCTSSLTDSKKNTFVFMHIYINMYIYTNALMYVYKFISISSVKYHLSGKLNMVCTQLSVREEAPDLVKLTRIPI